MRETASGGMALSPTGLLAEGLASLCEGGGEPASRRERACRDRHFSIHRKIGKDI